jgi:hypothetical protein
MCDETNEGFDLTGIGKVAKAIPEEVYTKSTDVILTTFEKLTSPITETTSGFGRYLRQKFDNMVEVEKALATYSLEKAIRKADKKIKEFGGVLRSPLHPKSFVKSIEESSKETNPLLHEMWTNLLASQLTEPDFHPHFVEILPHFGPSEAQLLVSLLPRDSVGPNIDSYLSYSFDFFTHYVKNSEDKELNDWTYSCVLLCEFKFSDVLGLKGKYEKKEGVTLLYRTKSGDAFLSAVNI